jgi:hypothetical protein
MTILSNPGWSRSDSAGPITGNPARLYPLASHSASVGSRCDGNSPSER